MDTSKIKNINTEEVKNHLNNIGDFKPRINYLPETACPRLFFYSEENINAGYYDFTIDDLDFKNCWIQPFSKVVGEPTRYCSGSYYVIQNSI
jgi:hypothetical protein